MKNAIDMPDDLRPLSLPELASLVNRLIAASRDEPGGSRFLGSEDPRRIHVVTALAEVSRRLETPADEDESSALSRLHADLSRWMLEAAPGRRTPRKRRPFDCGSCMCSTAAGDESSPQESADTREQATGIAAKE